MTESEKPNQIAKTGGVAPGWGSLGSWLQQAFAPRGGQDPDVTKGRKLAKAGDYSQALSSFMQFYARRKSIGHLIRRRNANAVFDLLSLADIYPPAKEAAVGLAQSIEDEIAAQQASDEDISDWCTIIRHLGELDRAWQLYNALLAKNDTRAGKLAGVVYAQLIAEKRFAEARETAMENARWTIEEVDPQPKNMADQTQLFSYWLPAVYEAFEVLLACNDKEQSSDLEKWAMKITPQASIYDGLIRAAEKAGSSETAARLAEARARVFPSKP